MFALLTFRTLVRSWSPTLACCALAFLALFPPATRAADEEKPDPARHSVFVPYDGTHPPDTRQAQRFYLDYQEFQRLWDLAKKAREPEAKGEAVPQGKGDVTLNSAQYRATVFEDHLEVAAQFDVVSHGGSWAKWSLPFGSGDIAVSSAEVDGKTAAFDHAELFFQTPGRHSVSLHFDIRESKNWRTAQFSIPASPAATLTIAVPSTDGRPNLGSVDESWVVESAPQAGAGHEYTFPVSNLSSMALTRTMAHPREENVPPASANANIHLRVSPQLEHLNANFRFGFAGVERDRFTLELEDQLHILSWDIPYLKSLSMRREKGRLILEIFLERPQANQYTMTLQAERLWKTPASRRQFPVLIAEARSRSAEWTVEALNNLDVRVPSAEGMERMAAQASATEPWVTVGTWRIAQNAAIPTYDVSPTGNRSSAKVETVYQLTRQKAEIIATLDLQAGRGSLREIHVDLPPGYEVETVAGPDLRDWYREDDHVMIHLTNSPHPSAKLALHLAHTAAQPTEEWDLRPLRLPTFEKVTNQALIAVHVADEVKLSFDANDRHIHEVDPDRLTTSVGVTPPFSYKRALEIQTQNWTAHVSLHRLAPRFAVDAVLLAKATDASLKISQLLAVQVEQGGLDHIKVRMPKELPEARVQGALVRDAQSSIVGASREYDISFQSEILQDTALSLEFELPLDGQSTLPVVQVPGADRLRTFLVTDNVSEREMRTEISDVEPAIRSSLPYLPEDVQRPVFYQAQPQSKVKISLTQLETTAANAALVTLAEITTNLRADGERWNTVVYSLANRSLQFLPVRLPSAAELVEVSVGGQNVRADLGKTTAPGSTLYLVPLIQMRAGQLSQQVRLVYRIPAAVVPKNLELEQPELEGFTVERTLWHVHTPPGMRLKHWDGNMEEVPEVVMVDEKNLQKLADASRLNRLITSGKVSSRDAQEAMRNAGKAIEEVKELQKAMTERSVSRRRLETKDRTAADKEEKSQEELQRQVQEQSILLQGNLKKQQAPEAAKEPQGQSLIINKTGAGTWQLQKSGQLQLSGANTYNGGTVISNGSWAGVNDNVVVGRAFFGENQAAIASGGNSYTHNARAASTNANAGPQSTYDATLSVTPPAANSEVNINGLANLGRISNPPPNPATAQNANGTITISSASSVPQLQLGQAVSGTGIPSNTVTISGVITGSGAITKAGTGTLTITPTTAGVPILPQHGFDAGMFGAGKAPPSANTFSTAGAGGITFNKESDQKVPAQQPLTIAGGGMTFSGGTTITAGTTQSTPQNSIGGAAGGFATVTSGNSTVGSIQAAPPNTVNGIAGGYTTISGSSVPPPATPYTGSINGGIVMNHATGALSPSVPQTAPQNAPAASTPPPAQQVKRHLELAQANYELGLLDEAVGEYENVLRIDPYNKTARFQMEKMEREKSRYYDVARNHTRAKFLHTTSAMEENVAGEAGTAFVSSQLKPAGRISLRVEVPEDGAVYHFRKLKDHAVLDLTLEKPWSLQQQTNLAVLIIGIVVLFLLDAVRRMWLRRSARHATAC